MTVFALPDLGEGLQEAEIVAWHVVAGDHVIVDQPLVSVETDKAVVEVPAPYSGTISRLLVAEGEIVEIGEPLVEINTGKAQDAAAIVGDIPQSKEPPREPKPKRRPRASPAVRRLAQERGVDLVTVAGSGPGGTILSHDIPAVSSAAVDGEELRGVRRAMASAMAKSHTTVVPATLTDFADIHDWHRDELPTPRLIHALVVACRSEPALNAWFDGQRRKLHEHIDVAIAVDTPEGLFAPVLRSAAICDNIREEITNLRRSVTSRSILPDALKGATITLSNFGKLGGVHAALVVTPPQVAILGAGRVSDVCAIVNGVATARRRLPLSLTFDHRVVTGGEAARFMAAVRADLERKTIPIKD